MSTSAAPAPKAPANQPPPYNAAEENAAFHEFAELSRHTVKRPIVLFFGRATFSDNTKYLYLAAAQAMADHDVIWCTWSKALFAQLTKHGLKAFDVGADPLKSTNLFLYASVAVFCENPAAALYLNSALSGCLDGAKKIQLWHGVSVKHLDLMTIEHLNIRDAQFRRQVRMATRVDYFLSTSSRLDAFWLNSHGCTTLVRAGQPRNEVIVRKPTAVEMIGAELPEAQASLLNATARKKILVAPTWQRGKPLYIWTQPFFDRAAKWAEANNATVFVKLHPFLLQAGLPANIGDRVIFLNAGVDIYPWLSKFDAMITDYSSIMFDFLLTGRPIFTFDSRTQVAWGFEPDYSLIPEGGFRYEFDATNFEKVINDNLSTHPLAAAQRELAGKIYETPPADACAHLLSVIQELSRAAVDKDFTVITPALPANLTRIAV
jgi:CDP-glycerol glycerophosphotransferase (TagB/SpsB family)